MKEKYYETNFEEKRKTIDRLEILAEDMKSIEYNDAVFTVSDIGISFIRIFLYPANNEKFTREQIKELTRAINKKFPSENTDWEKDFREENGTALLKRSINKYFKKPNSELLFLIENAPPAPQCKIIEKIVTKKMFVMDCKGEK